MSDQHLSYFKVENFKCFENLEVEDIGQFNLIVGDNNVGKTSLLEALMANDTHPNVYFNRLLRVFSLKDLPLSHNANEIFNYIHFGETKKVNFIKFSFKTSIKGIEAENTVTVYKNQFGVFYENEQVKDSLLTPTAFINDGVFEKIETYIPISQTSNNKILFDLFTKISDDFNLQLQLEEEAKIIIPDLARIQPSKTENNLDAIKILRHNVSQTLPITAWGEGTVRIFRLLMELILCKNNRLLIDEIDTGIHYSRMKDFLKKLILLAEKNGTQLFMTTHSEECQRFFLEIFEEDEELKELQKKVRHIEMYRNKNGLIKAATRNFGVALESLKMGIEIRR